MDYQSIHFLLTTLFDTCKHASVKYLLGLVVLLTFGLSSLDHLPHFVLLVMFIMVCSTLAPRDQP